MNWVPVFATVIVGAAIGLGLFAIWALCRVRSIEEDRMDERVAEIRRER